MNKKKDLWSDFALNERIGSFSKQKFGINGFIPMKWLKLLFILQKMIFIFLEKQ